MSYTDDSLLGKDINLTNCDRELSIFPEPYSPMVFYCA